MRASPSIATLAGRRFELVIGAVCGLLLWIIGAQLGLIELVPGLRDKSAWWALLMAAGGGAIYCGRARRVLLSATAALMALWFLVCFCPLSRWMSKPLLVAMPPRHADAVVVLSSSMQPDGDWDASSLARLMRGLELMRGQYAPLLIVTDVAGQSVQMKAAVQHLAANLRLPLTVESVGPVRDTHDEALAVSHLMQTRGWKTILLVTSPSHSRRSWLVFRKTGLDVISVPTWETRYDFENPQRSLDRLNAFNAALREIVGLQIYRLRGWI